MKSRGPWVDALRKTLCSYLKYLSYNDTQLWNCLPAPVRDLDTVPVFKSRFKTYLFTQALQLVVCRSWTGEVLFPSIVRLLPTVSGSTRTGLSSPNLEMTLILVRYNNQGLPWVFRYATICIISLEAFKHVKLIL